MNTISERLRQAREHAGLTQTQLAKRAGVSQGAIGNLENGTRKQPRALFSIAHALGVDPAWLESGKVAAYPTNAPQHAGEPLATYSLKHTTVQEALDTLERELVELDMLGRERIASLLACFARSPGDVAKRDIATALQEGTSKSKAAA